MRVGIIGFGAVGESHLKAIRDASSGAEFLVSDVIPEARQRAAELGAAVETEWQSLLDRSLDALVIATDPSLRLEPLKEAATRGVWTLLEKPVCLSVAELEALEALRLPKVYVSQFLRFTRGLSTLRARVQGGDVGSVMSVSISGRARRAADAPDWYFDPKRGGGATLESLCHSVDAAYWLLDSTFDRVSAEVVLSKHGEFIYDSAVAAVGRTRTGVVALLSASFGGPVTRRAAHRIDVVGTAGVITVDDSAPRDVLQSDATGGVAEALLVETRSNALTHQWRAFESLIVEENGSSAPGRGVATLAEGLAVMRTVFEIRDAALA